MLRRTPFFSALEPAVLASGLTPDIHPVKAPLWKEGVGVEFVDGKIRNRKSNRKLLHAEDAPVHGMVQQKLSNGEIAVWFVQNNNLWRWDQFSLSLQKNYPVGALNKPYFDFLSYGDWLLINRGFGSVDWWNGATFSVFPEMPSGVAMLLKHLSFVLALGIGSKGTGVGWSDANDISKWVSSRTNSAGALYIEEFNEGIVAGDHLGPVIAVYSSNQMAVVSFIGSPFYFGYKVMLTGIGAIGPEAVVSAGELNYGVSRQGIWATDGQQYQYIDRGALNTYLQENVNWSAGHKILAVRNDILRTVEFHFPMGTSFDLNEGWSFDPATKGWSKIAACSFYDQNLVLGLPLRAAPDGEISFVNSLEYTKTALLLRTRPMLMQLQSPSGISDAHFDTKVDEIELLLHAARNCQMRIGSSKEQNGTIHWSAPMVLSEAQSTYKVPAGVPDGTYWHLEFTSLEQTEVVTTGEEPVLEDEELVEAVTPDTFWKLNLQGFMLFGAVEGTK